MTKGAILPKYMGFCGIIYVFSTELTITGYLQFREAAMEKDDAALLKTMSNYGMRLH